MLSGGGAFLAGFSGLGSWKSPPFVVVVQSAVRDYSQLVTIAEGDDIQLSDFGLEDPPALVHHCVEPNQESRVQPTDLGRSKKLDVLSAWFHLDEIAFATSRHHLQSAHGRAFDRARATRRLPLHLCPHGARLILRPRPVRQQANHGEGERG
ncbi:MAG: hypothetical protein U0935_01905 [Pirellulales bacterium]